MVDEYGVDVALKDESLLENQQYGVSWLQKALLQTSNRLKMIYFSIFTLVATSDPDIFPGKHAKNIRSLKPLSRLVTSYSILKTWELITLHLGQGNPQ